MTHHIVRSEAGRPLPHVQIRTGAKRRRRAPLSMVVKAHLAVVALGTVAGLADVAIGEPICISLILGAYFAWCFWPSR